MKRSGIKSCLIAVLIVFSWTFDSLLCFLIDVVGVLLIAVARAVKKTPFFVQSSTPSFSLKSSFAVIFFSLFCIRLTKKCWLGFGVKQILDSLSFLFLLTHIGLNFNSKSAWIIELIMKICIHRLFFFFKNWTNQTKKKNALKIIPYFASAPRT